MFGQSCTLTSLTRYTYRNLIQGRPAYDDVQVINGSTIQPAAPRAPPARCSSRGTGLAVTPVAEPPATVDAGPTPLTAATGRKRPPAPGGRRLPWRLTA